MRHEMTMVHHVKDEMEDLRDVVDRMEDQCRRRKNHLLQQVCSTSFRQLFNTWHVCQYLTFVIMILMIFAFYFYS